MVLVGLSWPRRLFELCYVFGRSVAWLSVVFTDTVLFLTARYKTIIEWHPLINHRRIRHYARALRPFGGSGILFGFIDGTFLGVCRPSIDQRKYYSGYKKRHGIKYQGIVFPDGLIGSLDGPHVGEANDNSMVELSRLTPRLDTVFLPTPPSFVLSNLLTVYRSLKAVVDIIFTATVFTLIETGCFVASLPLRRSKLLLTTPCLV